MRDPDDWFVELEPPPARRDERGEPSARGDAAGDDDWLGEGAEEDGDARLSNRWAAGVAGALLVVVLLIAGLVLGGVFGSSKHPQAATTTLPATTQAPTTPTTTAQTTATIPPPTTTLKPGDTGAQVTLLQRALASLGYSAGKFDGNYGPSTTSAVTKFQTAQKLTADGVFGPATLAALVSALHGP